MPDKLTDNEIKKALEICASDNLGCEDGCPYVSNSDFCSLKKDTIELINRLELKNYQLEKQVSEIQNANLIDFKATIENYKAENKSLKAEVERLADSLKLYRNYNPAIRHARKEAYKECIEKVEQIICDNTYPDFDINHKAVNIWKAEAYKKINNLLNELVGDGDGKRKD